MQKKNNNNALCLKQGQRLKTSAAHLFLNFLRVSPRHYIKPKGLFSGEEYHWIYAILPGMLHWSEGPIFNWVTKSERGSMVWPNFPAPAGRFMCFCLPKSCTLNFQFESIANAGEILRIRAEMKASF